MSRGEPDRGPGEAGDDGGGAPVRRAGPAGGRERSDDVAHDPDRRSIRIAPGQALYFFGVARARTWRGGRVANVAGEDVVRIRYRDLEALVRPVPYELPQLDEAAVLAHQKVVDGAMRRNTVLPAPFGVIFRGRRQLVRLLQEQYLVLDEGLSFLDGHWELRLHVVTAGGGEPELELSDMAMQLYSELRRHARAAVPLPAEGRRLLSAAFLVERSAWLEFMERAEDLNQSHPEVTFDITGPWPPYDFVRITV
ncbi:MAG TPA: GvpL/GvpF family gas vesicle protein [Longimicrobiales bacterium]|nr:GvpL/GvpF family gas vesicle protein [Longimicrobiales bacterium]